LVFFAQHGSSCACASLYLLIISQFSGIAQWQAKQGGGTAAMPPPCQCTKIDYTLNKGAAEA